jgi:hypothetical protein
MLANTDFRKRIPADVKGCYVGRVLVGTGEILVVLAESPRQDMGAARISAEQAAQT